MLKIENLHESFRRPAIRADAHARGRSRACSEEAAATDENDDGGS